MIAFRLIFLFFLATLGLGGCSTTEELTDQKIAPEVLYSQGVEALRDGKWSVALLRFQDVDRKHPFSPWATRAQANLIYAHYKKDEYDETVSAAERFIRLHPRHKQAPYAFHMRGLAFYRRVSDAFRDQKRTQEAMVAFREVISRFPDSDYAWEAKRMLALCQDRVAEQEMVVGRYYLDRAEYVAATNRFETLVNDPVLSRTPYAEEALFSLVLSAYKLGLVKESRNYAVVLGHNFPNGLFYRKAVKLIENGDEVTRGELKALRAGVKEGSMFSRFFGGLAPALVPGAE